MRIASYLKTSLIEWPGKITSVVFTPGCNFRCPFCHNADLADPEKSRRLTLIPEKEIFADLKKRKKWVDAVVITGGEPTLQTDLPKFLKVVKSLEFLTMIHTNGTRPEVIASLLDCSIIDYVAMDLKGDLKEYEKYIGCQKSKVKSQSASWRTKVKSSIEIIAASGVEYEFRTTVVPGMHDIKNLIALAEQIKFLVQSSSRHRRDKVQGCRWFLQQFRPVNCLDKSYLKKKPFSKEEMEGFLEELQKILPQTYLRGV